MGHGLLHTLAQRRPVVGCWHAIQDAAVTETLKDIALDFLVFDQQHVAVTIETLQHAFIALGASPMASLVRVLGNDAAGIGQVLDAGADGVIVPMVNTADDARRAVAAAKYPPEGIRSFGPRRATLRYADLAEYVSQANHNIVLVQIETAEAVSNVDAILSVPGINGIMIGPGDLAISLGYMSDMGNPAVRDVVQGVLDRCLHHDVPFGIFTDSVESSVYWIERGGLILGCYADVVWVTDGMTKMAAEFAQVRSRQSGPHAHQGAR